MKIAGYWLVWMMLIACAYLAAGATIDDADALFQQGRFADAEKAYATVLAADPKNAQAEKRLGELALFSNNFDDAEKHLKKAVELTSEPKKAQSLLGQVFFRQDNFQEAAKWYRAAGSESKAAELKSYKGVTPYRIEGPGAATSLKLLSVDPLPTVQVKVNGSDAVEFLIDTGGPEVVVEKDYAKQLGLVSVGATTGTFAGGQHAETQHSRASFTLGVFVVKDVPILMLPLPQVEGTHIRGIIGTDLLYHFLATLDYPGGQLLLRRRSPDALKRFAQQATAEGQIVIPFWMSGDHFMVAWGRVNQSPPALLFVDTGFSQGGFLCPDSTLKEAGITVGPPEVKTGQQDPVKPVAAQQAASEQTPSTVPFVVGHLWLGDAQGENIKGMTGIFPPSLENAFGFRIAGLISHQFFRNYAVTFDFTGMRIFLKKK